MKLLLQSDQISFLLQIYRPNFPSLKGTVKIGEPCKFVILSFQGYSDIRESPL